MSEHNNGHNNEHGHCCDSKKGRGHGHCHNSEQGENHKHHHGEGKGSCCESGHGKGHSHGKNHECCHDSEHEGGKGKNKGGSFGKGGFCVCANCGAKKPHEQDTKCTTLKCPECGKTMVRQELLEHMRS